MTTDIDTHEPIDRLVRALAELATTQAELSAALDSASVRACRLIEAIDLSIRIEAATNGRASTVTAYAGCQ